jgi:methyl-accepting chemotaxis protein
MKPLSKPNWRDVLMSPFVNLHIQTRLTVCFGGVFLLMAAMGIFATLRMSQTNARMTMIVQSNNMQIARVNQMIYSVGTRSVALRNLALLKDPEARQKELEILKDEARDYASAETDLLALIAKYDASEAEKALLEAIKRAETTTVALMAQAAELGMAGKTEEAVDLLMNKVRQRQGRWITVLQTMSGLQQKSAGEYAEDAAVAFEKARMTMIGFVCAALAAGITLAWLVTRTITLPIREAVRLAQTAAQGDLTARSSLRRNDETGHLLAALQTMSSHLAEVVHGVRQGSEHIVSATAEIATGSGDLSQRTERQAASLQQTAASMEEIRATVHTSADTSRRASAMANSASSAAQTSFGAVNQVVQTMQDIAQSSKRIADITGVIDGIAFQTNILALNAAVEAARAGEQGRGFAVVAAEVRSLAQRSASSAREIKSLIGASVDKVEQGTRQAADAGRTVEDVVQQVRNVSALIDEISHATQQQTSGIDQVGDAVTDMDQATQQNAALAEESAAAAETLRQQAAQLLESVSAFRVQTAHG